jgi:Domain of unknown function (DUF4328)
VDPPRPLLRLGQAVIGLLGLVIVVNLAALAVDLIQLGLMMDIRDGRRVSLEQLTESDDRVATVGLLQVGAYAVCAIAFLIWYGRAFRNLARLGARGLHWGRRWVIAYWFVPIVSLLMPKQVIDDIWRASDPKLPAVTYEWDTNRVPVLFHVWWILWIISAFVGNLLFRRSLDAQENPDELVSAATGFVVVDVIDLIPAVLAILVVRAITNRQEERRGRHERGELPWTAEVPAVRPAAEPAL